MFVKKRNIDMFYIDRLTVFAVGYTNSFHFSVIT